jgi:hypothetical protein
MPSTHGGRHWRALITALALVAGFVLLGSGSAPAAAPHGAAGKAAAERHVERLRGNARTACARAARLDGAARRKTRRLCRSRRARARRAGARLRVTAPAPAPVAPAPESFEAGVVSGSDVLNEARVTGRLGARLVRVEFRIGTPAAALRPVIAAHALNGTRVLPLAGFHGTMPTVADARSLGEWAREFGPGGTFWAGRSDGRLAVREIEFGNETSYGYQYGDQYDRPSYAARAREYALRLKDAHEAIRAANPRVGLLGQIEDANTGSPNWIDGVFGAVPDIASRVTGWTIHPYGPRSKWEPRMDRLLAWTAARGAALPMWVTEWGVASDDGRCLSDNYGWDRCMTYAAAATTLESTVGQMRSRYGSRLRALVLYHGHDFSAPGAASNREHYFGALRSDLGDKGPYSAAVRSLLAGS